MDIIISVFEKEFGPLKIEHGSNYENAGVYAFDFINKNKITLKILLIETETNHWVINHEFSKENPFFLRKVVRICERIQRINDDKYGSFSLSAELKDVQKEMFLTTAIKCAIQNRLNHLTLFPPVKEKQSYSPKKSIEMKVDR